MKNSQDITETIFFFHIRTKSYRFLKVWNDRGFDFGCGIVAKKYNKYVNHAHMTTKLNLEPYISLNMLPNVLALTVFFMLSICRTTLWTSFWRLHAMRHVKEPGTAQPDHSLPTVLLTDKNPGHYVLCAQ